MVDAYTKLVLTVIAIALIAIVVRLEVPKASAAQGCGSRIDPCHVEVEVTNSTLFVEVTNREFDVEVTNAYDFNLGR